MADEKKKASSLIKKPHELEVVAIVKALLYGQPGIGKSTLALSAPKPLYIDCDDGAHRVQQRHLTDTIPARNWLMVTEVLTVDLDDYDTIIIDVVGKMLMFMNEYVGKMNQKNRQLDGTLTQKGFGVRKQLFMEFLAKIAQLGKHIIFIAQDEEEKRGDIMFARPRVGGSSGQDLVGELDLVGYIQAIGNTRTVSFDPTEYHFGKNTIGLPPVMELPDVNVNKNNLLTQIFTQFSANVKSRHEVNASYMRLMVDITDRVAGITNATGANEAYKWLNDFEGHIFQSRDIGKSLVVKKAKELGLMADVATKMFVAPPPAAAPAPEVKPDDGKGKGKNKDDNKVPPNGSTEAEAKQGVDTKSETEEERLAREKIAAGLV